MIDENAVSARSRPSLHERGAHPCSLLGPSGRRSPSNVKAGDAQQDQSKPEQGRELLDALSEFENLLSEFQPVSFATSRLTVTVGTVRSHPRAVDRGTPSSVAMVRSPVRCTSSPSRWS